jgi:hypothetical protein
MDEIMRSVRSSVSSIAEFQREHIFPPLQQLLTLDKESSTPLVATQLTGSTGKSSYQTSPEYFDRDMAQVGSSMTAMGSLWFMSGNSSPPMSIGASRGAAVLFVCMTAVGLAKLAQDEGQGSSGLADQDVKK